MSDPVLYVARHTGRELKQDLQKPAAQIVGDCAVIKQLSITSIELKRGKIRRARYLKPRYPRSQLLGFLKAFKKKHNRRPTQRDTGTPDIPCCFRTITKEFGSWKKSSRLIGFHCIKTRRPFKRFNEKNYVRPLELQNNNNI
jgi:hypothetical protein